ncbi:MAG TPA: ABC transporter ATP-binding protein [Candidatus Acidoferrum sp.]|nr:ABC transporter ATP-binding protein [Candidatus Acidoferrum sp.]
MTTNIIELSGVEFGYRKRRAPLFHQLDLVLPAGTICGLLGTNGAGKSTLLKMLAGLSFPQAGRCCVLGHEPGKREPDFLADVFLLPEEIHVPALSATAYVERYGCLYPRFDHQLLGQVMQDFALPSDRALTTLSQGQKKKFLLAFGLATCASLFIMDEPTNGLDIPGKQEFRRALINHFSLERSFIISTHQVHDLQGLIDSVMIIADGRILLHESVDRLSSTLRVEMARERPADALFVEETLEGFRILRVNESGMDTNIDLSLLFGCALSQPELLQSLLGKTQQQEAA